MKKIFLVALFSFAASFLIADTQQGGGTTTGGGGGGPDTTSIARNGGRPPTADQPWGGFKITGLADPTAAQDAATKNYVDTQGFIITEVDPVSLHLNGDNEMGASIIPDTTDVYDLGSLTNKWRDLYLKEDLFLGDSGKITLSDPSGAMEIFHGGSGEGVITQSASGVSNYSGQETGDNDRTDDNYYTYYSFRSGASYEGLVLGYDLVTGDHFLSTASAGIGTSRKPLNIGYDYNDDAIRFEDATRVEVNRTLSADDGTLEVDVDVDFTSNNILNLGFARYSHITTPATPPASANSLYFKSDDELYKIDSAGSEVQISGLPAGNIEVQDEGTPLTTAVTKFNFVGAGVTVTEPVADEMLVTIAGGASQNLFETFATPLGTSPVADTATDTLTYASTDLDITGDSGTDTVTLDVKDNAVTYAKMQDVSTTNVFLGRDTAGAGDTEEISAAAARTILNVADGATAGDADAIHDNVASEISAITVKGTPVGGDFLLIEDSAAANVKKHILISSLPAAAHASTHIDGGSDVVDGDKVEITWVPSEYIRDSSPSEADSLDDLTAHLAGIDNRFAMSATELFNDTIQTTDATVTTIRTVSIADNFVENIDFDCVAMIAAGTKGAGRQIKGTFRNPSGAGNVVGIGSVTTIYSKVDTPNGYSTALTISTDDILLQVTGHTAETVEWRCKTEIISRDGTP